MFNKFLKNLKSDLKNKKKVRSSYNFLLFFLISFSLVYLFLNIPIIYNYINYFFGSLSNFILNSVFGIDSKFYFLINNSIIEVSSLSYPIIITNLCTGILEFSILVSAIIATIGVSIKKKLTWVFFSTLIVIVFNIIRISLTSFIIVRFNLSFANFVHGFLFRLFLIIIVLGTYWFFLNSKK
ncbi:MAG: exosortase/archaeosortase family protein [archaeon]|jgi:exosortase/archaeosortase family protein|nr:exosortase/archaeosortase family protein [archaeon]MDD2477566.1 exosortase/archaeosortase family protein [Candidatus ainarchaeum sp.]MDD3084338.1 exosortase/archaeosortase family protein [Candidatus ainarchaeum sp.]MDD4221080.1 exosortase/archaeosortase family protein [Candidatus ainarchaeum sp.]MDD4662551.1 exosortase/archaeosortase family protein [Candidatus ainarchaeum sp.]